MALQDARNLVIKREVTTGNFSFVCGIRTRSMSIGNAVIDTTRPSCDDPSLPIVETGEPGRQTLRFSGDGLFDSDAVSILVADDARLQRTPNWQIIWPGYGTWQGPFMIANFEGSGEMDDKLAFSAEWVPINPDDLVFTAA